MRVGTAWEDITPSEPMPLMGQMHVRMPEYTHDPLTLNAVVFEQSDERVAVVSVDVCYLPDDLVRKMQAACAAACEIAPGKVIIAATHTHVAPCTTEKIAGDPHPSFLARLQEAATSAVSRSIDDLEEAELFAGSGYLEDMGWNRRGLREDGAGHMYFGSWQKGFVGIEGPRDGQVGVIFARTTDGTIKVVIPNFSTHPNTLEGEKFYSADIPGEVRRVLRGILGEGLGVVYLTGAAGNTAPTIMEKNPNNIQPWRGEEGLKRSGQNLGGEILRVIARAIHPMADDILRHEQTVAKIPIREWDNDDFSYFSGGMKEFFERSRDNWAQKIENESPVDVHINVLRIGEAVICFNPAELYCEFGLAIKQKSPAGTTLVAELSDGGVGYVPTPQAVRHGGYSAQVSDVTQLVPEAGWIIVRETEKLLGKAFSHQR